MSLKMTPLAVSFGLLILVSCVRGSWGQVESSDVPFTVSDSIEMKTFSDPFTRTQNATAKEAPDGRGFVVVTTEGHLASNTLTSTLWYFPKRALERFVNRRDIAAPQPERLFQIVGVPEAEQPNSYGSLITDVQWSTDSRNLLFLVEQEHGIHHAYELSLDDKRATDMTAAEPGDVMSPVSLGGTVAYLASEQRGRHGGQQDSGAIVLTGRTLYDALFPEAYPDGALLGPAWKLKVRFNGQTNQFPREEGKFFPFMLAGYFDPAISPAGDKVLTLSPVSGIPSSWSAYWSGVVTREFPQSDPSTDKSGRTQEWPWHYVLVDLRTGRSESLFNAPTGQTMSAGNLYEAKWSPSGERVVATYSYFPIGEKEHHSNNSIKPCAIAEFVVETHATACLAMMPPPEQGKYLMSVGYDSSENIAAQWMTRGKLETFEYDRATQLWTLVPGEHTSPHGMELYIRQEMDTPPELWVRSGGTDRLLWDPNPQLRRARFGKASLYQWTDSSGYSWRGGLVLPPGPKPPEGYPLVIQTHGFYNEHEFLADGAFTTGNAAQPLACAGIAVLQMEDRVGRHTRPALEEANDAVRGIESAVDHLSEDRLVDPSRIGIEGFSRTSWYVEKALEHSPYRYKAALLIDGVDMSYVQNVLFAPGAKEFTSEADGANGAKPFGTGLSKWIENAAGFNLDKITAAVQLEAIGKTYSILGEWETYSILRQQGKPVDLIDIPDGQHVLQKPKNRYESQQGAVDWFRFWLQGYERKDPEAKDENDRWRQLRSLVAHTRMAR